MSERRNRQGVRRGGDEGRDEAAPGSRFVFGTFWALLFVGTLAVAGPWAGFHGVLLGCVGLLMLLRPPVVGLPRLWWLLAAMFLLAGAAAFLPAGWFGVPEWRRSLAGLGIETGSLVVIQSRQALETFGMFAIMLLGGLWLAGHRPSSSQVRLWALTFTMGVAAYAVIARIMQEAPPVGRPGTETLFGFFPNRNHTATYLAMGAICGLGNVLQAIRDKRLLSMAVALVGTGVCLWAVAGWSVSRSGVVLVAIGCLAWLPMLGTRYLGRQGLRALGLIAVAVLGLFFIVDTGVKDRLAKTLEKANTVIAPADPADPADPETPGDEKPTMEASQDLDFRIPTMLDTLGLIGDFKWTGIGAGQYRYIFPQYRKLTAVANDSDNFHPESDWLWMAAETGVPATLALAALVVLAFWKARGAIVVGRDRALRSACLIAALLVPIHGIFDVPGHRITLAWSAAWLFALALYVPPSEPRVRSPRAWPFRLAALALLAAAAFLLRAQWGGGPQPDLVTGQLAHHQALSLYEEDQALQKSDATKDGEKPTAPDGDLLERALGVLSQAQTSVPLERKLYHLQGFLALHFDDKTALAQRAFAIERALDPTWVAAPLQQARAWLAIDPEQAAFLWGEALQRARQLDHLRAGPPSSENRTRQSILQQVRGNPAMERLWSERFGGQN